VDNKKFATAINCMDGRVQLPVIEWLKKSYGVDYVDNITEPGPSGILAENKDAPVIELIKKKVQISVNKHGSKLIAIAGHYDCTANPEDKETQASQILTSIKKINSWGFNAQVIGLWVDENLGVHLVKSLKCGGNSIV